jgi:SNF2 family DNA or RNA helicase
MVLTVATTLSFSVILDEAQCIKNRATMGAKGAKMLTAKYRLCLTGTPMMNNVSELHSLIEFLRIKPYCDAQRFNQVSSWLSRASDSFSYSATSYRRFTGRVFLFY